MKRLLILFGLSIVMLASAFAQDKQRKDTAPLPKKTKQPPDTAFKNPIFKGPAEIDTLNQSDSIKRGGRVTPLNRYREDTLPKKPRIY